MKKNRALGLSSVCCKVGILASLAWALMLSASYATVGYPKIVYNVLATPNTLPQSTGAGWIAGPLNTGHSNIVTATTLTLVDPDNLNSPYYDTPTYSVSELGPTREFEMTSRVKMLSYSANDASSRAGYAALAFDNSREVGFGIRLDISGNHQFFFLSNTGTPVTSVYTDLDGPADGQYFNVGLRKSGTTGTSSDTVSLYVDGTQVMSTTYFNMISGFAGIRSFEFGAGISPPSSTVEMQSVSFEIFIPEPSMVSLGLVGWFMVRLRLRRS